MPMTPQIWHSKDKNTYQVDGPKESTSSVVREANGWKE